MTSVVALVGGGLLSAPAASAAITPPTPIEHVVVIYQENHSFDETLGKLCVNLNRRCDGVVRGDLPSGNTRALSRAKDVVINAEHTKTSQITAMNGGKMNGFAKIPTCAPSTGYSCYTQYYPSQIPNLAALAKQFVISDRTFTMDPIPSWGAHLALVAGTLNGFTGGLPHTTDEPPGPGWGCDSRRDAPWRPSPGAAVQQVPSCIPFYGLDNQLFPHGGAYRPTPVKPVPTIMDRMATAGLSWRIYYSTGPGPGSYQWATCPSFAKCVYTSQRNNAVPSDQVISDATNGDLPNLSVVIPEGSNSQHNYNSMAKGDNWIGNIVGAVQSGSDWRSTAIFITYDDCGCFYDHVAPPVKAWGIRVPMVIISPYARRGFTDSRSATFASMLAFVQHVFDLNPLSTRVDQAYDYSESFNFNRARLKRTEMTRTHISARERRYLKAHPVPEDDPMYAW